MTTYALKQDANHTEIKDAYETMGVSVLDLSKVAQLTRPGCPDLLCALHGYTWLSETKTDVGELSPAQVSFFDWWKGPVFVVRTVDDVIARVTAIRSMTGAGRFVKRVSA